MSWRGICCSHAAGLRACDVGAPRCIVASSFDEGACACSPFLRRRFNKQQQRMKKRQSEWAGRAQG